MLFVSQMEHCRGDDYDDRRDDRRDDRDRYGVYLFFTGVRICH